MVLGSFWGENEVSWEGKTPLRVLLLSDEFSPLENKELVVAKIAQNRLGETAKGDLYERAQEKEYWKDSCLQRVT